MAILRDNLTQSLNLRLIRDQPEQLHRQVVPVLRLRDIKELLSLELLDDQELLRFVAGCQTSLDQAGAATLVNNLRDDRHEFSEHFIDEFVLPLLGELLRQQQPNILLARLLDRHLLRRPPLLLLVPLNLPLTEFRRVNTDPLAVALFEVLWEVAVLVLRVLDGLVPFLGLEYLLFTALLFEPKVNGLLRLLVPLEGLPSTALELLPGLVFAVLGS